MTAEEAQNALGRLGFTMKSLASTLNSKDICRGATSVGTVRFDEYHRVAKLELSPLYFSVGRVVLREFADAVFDRYSVKPTQVADDICFWDVTCFRGSTLSEQFLILRIAEDVQLHVSKKRTNTTDIQD
jgi:hypothetical protein